MIAIHWMLIIIAKEGAQILLPQNIAKIVDKMCLYQLKGNEFRKDTYIYIYIYIYR